MPKFDIAGHRKIWFLISALIIIPGLFLVITLLCITDLGNYLRKETNRKSSNL